MAEHHQRSIGPAGSARSRALAGLLLFVVAGSGGVNVVRSGESWLPPLPAPPIEASEPLRMPATSIDRAPESCPQMVVPGTAVPRTDAAAGALVVEPGRARRGLLFHQPRTSLPTGVTAEPLTGVLDLEIIGDCAGGCDPRLYGQWMHELATALNATPLLRVHRVREVECALPVIGSSTPQPLSTDVSPQASASLLLYVTVRSIEAYRPMRLDADIRVIDPASAVVLAALDGVWQAPTDSVPLRPTRWGWFRRNWHPPAAVREAEALEATSPVAFLRGSAQQVAQSLCTQLQTGGSIIAPGR